jgi:hypothetical protein
LTMMFEWSVVGSQAMVCSIVTWQLTALRAQEAVPWEPAASWSSPRPSRRWGFGEVCRDVWQSGNSIKNVGTHGNHVLCWMSDRIPGAVGWCACV